MCTPASTTPPRRSRTTLSAMPSGTEFHALRHVGGTLRVLDQTVLPWEEQAASDAIAAHGADLLRDARRVMTHCNTGALAAPGRGTALAVIAELAERGTLELAIATESRPLLQGARLTVYELNRLGIPHE